MQHSHDIHNIHNRRCYSCGASDWNGNQCTYCQTRTSGLYSADDLKTMSADEYILHREKILAQVRADVEGSTLAKEMERLGVRQFTDTGTAINVEWRPAARIS